MSPTPRFGLEMRTKVNMMGACHVHRIVDHLQLHLPDRGVPCRGIRGAGGGAGLAGLAIADENSVAGVVRAHAAVREIARVVAERERIEARDGAIGPPAPEPRAPEWAHVPRFYPAARLVLREGLVLTALPETRQGWGRLSRLISAGRLRVEKGECDLRLDDLLEGMEDIVLLLHPPEGLCGTGSVTRGGW